LLEFVVSTLSLHFSYLCVLLSPSFLCLSDPGLFHCLPGLIYRQDQEARDHDESCYAGEKHTPRVSGLKLGLLLFSLGVEQALALLLPFRPLSLACFAALRQETHGRRESRMVARGPDFVRLIFLAPIERQLQFRVAPEVRAAPGMQVCRLGQAAVGPCSPGF